MKKEEFLTNLGFPLAGAVYKKYPLGNITQLWGENPSLYSQLFKQADDLHRFLSGHSGIDIATYHRDKVFAIHNGMVDNIKTDRTALGGLGIYIASDQLDDVDGPVIITSGYAHLDEILVKSGDRIQKGDHIGYEGNTGFVVGGTTPYWGNAPAGTGTHLHFGLYEFVLRNGVWVRRYDALGGTIDPLPFLTGDRSGWKILLANMTSLLSFWLRKLS